MKLTDEVIIPVPRVKVWQALNDPEVLRQAIPRPSPVSTGCGLPMPMPSPTTIGSIPTATPACYSPHHDN